MCFFREERHVYVCHIVRGEKKKASILIKNGTVASDLKGKLN